MDDLDAMIQGVDDSSVSQTGINNQSIDSTQPDGAIEQQSPEEVEFNKLTGSSQERFKKIVLEKRQVEERLANLERMAGTVPPPAPGGYQTSDNETVLNQLEQAGVATDRKVDRKLSESLNQLRYENEMTRLQSSYNGDRGEPQFVREEYEDYVSSHPQYRGYLPEDVFKMKMFQQEFSNLEVQQKVNPRTGNSRTLRPTRANAQQETLTPESIEERLRQPGGADWYDQNIDKINDVLGKMSTE